MVIISFHVSLIEARLPSGQFAIKPRLMEDPANISDDLLELSPFYTQDIEVFVITLTKTSC